VRVCDKLLETYRYHKGDIYCYGDSTGGAGGSAKVKGSDWDLVKDTLYPVYGNRLKFRVPKANPRERVRVNSVNSRLLNTYNEVFLVVDQHKCPFLIRDFEGTRVIEGGTGEIDKKRDPELTHLTDAVGYYVAKEYPIIKMVLPRQKYWK
jgi:hypothetical protein